MQDRYYVPSINLESLTKIGETTFLGNLASERLMKMEHFVNAYESHLDRFRKDKIINGWELRKFTESIQKLDNEKLFPIFKELRN
jgi:hypothetical protein